MISNDIKCLRKDLPILKEKAKGGTVLQRKISRLLSYFKCKNEEKIQLLIETIKQQFTAKS